MPVAKLRSRQRSRAITEAAITRRDFRKWLDPHLDGLPIVEQKQLLAVSALLRSIDEEDQWSRS